jgi:hypothetical protein
MGHPLSYMSQKKNMCGSSSFVTPLHEDDITTSSSITRRPVGTRRRQLEWLTNFVLVVVSLFGCSVGAGLIGFYQLHLLSFISYEFFVIPLVLLGKLRHGSCFC